MDDWKGEDKIRNVKREQLLGNNPSGPKPLKPKVERVKKQAKKLNKRRSKYQ